MDFCPEGNTDLFNFQLFCAKRRNCGATAKWSYQEWQARKGGEQTAHPPMSSGGTPHLGVPPIWGYPLKGLLGAPPHLGVPPPLHLGGTPPSGGTPHQDPRLPQGGSYAHRLSQLQLFKNQLFGSPPGAARIPCGFWPHLAGTQNEWIPWISSHTRVGSANSCPLQGISAFLIKKCRKFG